MAITENQAQSVLDEMSAEERLAFSKSVAKARAEHAEGKSVPGDAVFKWLASWGTDQELPPPRHV